ncbi:hypothetical protein ACFC26_14915 [Kitasatospora purpeofusca]|uniref:hypothetical protein n=1 Tax=Kitasatospora purpeofusca TaxID=67352 RepID=UPI0035D5ACF2
MISNTPVDQAKALRFIRPLADGTTTGLQQIARRADTVIIATLAQGSQHDTWTGIDVRIVSTAYGELPGNWFGFAEHSTFTRDARNGRTDVGALTPENQRDLLRAGGILPDAVRGAVDTYVRVFAAAEAPQFTAMHQIDGLWWLAEHLVDVRAIHPQALAGLSLPYLDPDLLNEVACGIYNDLEDLTGEWGAVQGARTTSIRDDLQLLRGLRSSLLALAVPSATGNRLSHKFRRHVETLDKITSQITTGLRRPAASAGDSPRRAAALITSATAPPPPAASPPTGAARGAGGEVLRLSPAPPPTAPAPGRTR